MKYRRSSKVIAVALAVLFIILLGLFTLSTHGLLFEFQSLRAPEQESSASPPLINEEDDLPPEPGKLHSVLHKQGLSHFAFHNERFQQSLASVLPMEIPQSILVVGVEWGEDVRNFAKLGYRVVAFEPLPKFYGELKKFFSSASPRGLGGKPANVTLLNMAAGSKKSTLKVRYRNQHEYVPQVRIDDMVDEPISILMADVQGNELDVLEGASKLIRTSVQMIWVEAIACNPKLPALLRLLDKENFIIYDFAPFGRPRDQELSILPMEERNFIYDPKRPADFKGYTEWFCKKKLPFPFLQTDLVAVKRTLHPSATSKLKELGAGVCALDPSVCVLRKFVRPAH